MPKSKTEKQLLLRYFKIILSFASLAILLIGAFWLIEERNPWLSESTLYSVIKAFVLLSMIVYGGKLHKKADGILTQYKACKKANSG